MQNITIKCLADLDDTFASQTAHLFVEAYYKDLAMLSKNKQKLVRAIKPTFVKQQVFVALYGDRVVGMIACSSKRQYAHQANKKALVKEFGLIKGTIFTEFLNNKPITLENHQGYIEDVATDPEFRGRGIASKLSEYMIKTMKYDELVLEVADTNTHAVKLYEKLGFEVFKTVRIKFFKRALGLNEKLYMKKSLTTG